MTPESNEEGIICPHCGTWNTHEECGTYQVLFPICKQCGECTEIIPPTCPSCED